MSEQIRPVRAIFSSLGAVGVLAFGLAVSTHSVTAAPSAIFSENFNSIVQTNTGTQADTGLTVGAWDNLSDWSSEGTHAVHDVDLEAGSAKDIAATFYSNNVITMSTGVAANNAGASYTVSLEVGPSVWSTASQASTSADGLVIYVLRPDNSVLYSSTQKSGAWNGTSSAQTLTSRSFSYIGDGTGVVRLRIGTIHRYADRFGGAIDNIQIESSPTTCAPTSTTSGGNTILKFTQHF
jgi:hypothetical protein